MSTRTLGISEPLYRYLLSVAVPEDPLAERLRDRTVAALGYNIQIAPEQAQFMRVLVKMLGAKKALEVGTFTGYSALTIARALPAAGRLTTCDISAQATSIAQEFWQQAEVSDKITLVLKPALQTLDELIADGQNDSFDFAFVDADKETYGDYYERCVSLVRSGGVIAIDNTLWGGAVADESDQSNETIAVRALNQRMAADPRVDTCLLTIGDGLSLALKH